LERNKTAKEACSLQCAVKEVKAEKIEEQKRFAFGF
jgi:hypothetical protein